MARFKIIKPVQLNSSDWTQIPIIQMGSILLQPRELVDVYVAEFNNPGNQFVTIKAGQSIEIETEITSQTLYAKSASGTVWLEIAYLSGN